MKIAYLKAASRVAAIDQSKSVPPPTENVDRTWADFDP